MKHGSSIVQVHDSLLDTHDSAQARMSGEAWRHS